MLQKDSGARELWAMGDDNLSNRNGVLTSQVKDRGQEETNRENRGVRKLDIFMGQNTQMAEREEMWKPGEVQESQGQITRQVDHMNTEIQELMKIQVGWKILANTQGHQ